MASITVSDAMLQDIEKACYVMAYLAKLHDQQADADGIYTVPVTIRKEGDSSFVIDIEGHCIEFDAEALLQSAGS